ncbi:hypothetical protein BTE77_34765 [Ensifer adhaerens]|nr:hypothetical protein BTE77_34765 [Ensifer adhaerens]
MLLGVVLIAPKDAPLLKQLLAADTARCGGPRPPPGRADRFATVFAQIATVFAQIKTKLLKLGSGLFERRIALRIKHQVRKCVIRIIQGV